MSIEESLPPLEVAAEKAPSLLQFVKAHACGNDFLILEETAAHRNHAELAKKLCARNTSVGADGIEFLDRQPDGTLFIRLFNSDGSEAELSGNGTRCVAAWLAATEDRNKVTLVTHGGPRTCEVVEIADPTYVIRTEMGVPRVMPRTIVVDGVGEVEGAMVNVGNPHFVLFVETEDFSAHGLSWQELGGKIAVSPLFPHGTNVEFVRVISPAEIAFRIYERGCGPTTSSGTGTCASSSAAMSLRGASRHLIAVAEGGPQRVSWESAEEPMFLTGPAEIICRGEVSGL
ncbi:diaminopimelate epimerase [Granulicella pectinivorans]|jgi:diaminopimelate epimerase|uniref:Diaminopimelate epimerase n=1 Tax=Granulicella pectinivorans TaxID=474950 RepID=A0A1I6N1C8_9BACT|nr:diaminopimelate epimerase [Granulicella pectinivorans]SFS21759.1 diaminopimelate epimerase [Granulicella pectinivorans]